MPKFPRIHPLLVVAIVAALLSIAPAGAVTNISSCTNLSSANETYVLISNISASGTCLTVSASGITIDGNGRTVTFGSSGNGVGIDVNQGGVEIHDLTIRLGTSNPTSGTVRGVDAKANTHLHHVTFDMTNNSSLRVSAVRSYGSGPVNIHDNTFDLDGSGSFVGIYLNGGAKTGQIYQNTMTLGANVRYSGGYPMQIYVDQSNPTSGSLNIHHNTMVTRPGGSAWKQQGVQLYRSDRVHVYSNQITMDGENHRGIYLYGYDNKAFDNTIVMKGNGGTSQGIRSRFRSGRTEMYGNTINATGCSADCYPILLGGEQSGIVPGPFTIHDNVISGDTDALIKLWLGMRDVQLWNNNLTMTGGSGIPIVFQKYDQTQDNISLNNTVITNNGTNSKAIRFVENGATNITLCNVQVDGSPLTTSMIDSGSGFNLTGGPCVYGQPGNAACDDGTDNDGDGLVDTADPGCSSSNDGSEYGTAECDDGVDNDGDGLADYRTTSSGLWGDPGCSGLSDTSESDCGNGVIDSGEQCDGSALGGASCTSLGYGGGTLACTGSCQYNTAGCSTAGLCDPIPSKSGWTVSFVDSEETTPGQAFPATNAIDEVVNTFWHTAWVNSPAPAHPHEFQVDLGGTEQVCGFTYLPRQDSGIEDMDGSVKDFEFYVSSDGVNWSNPVVQGVLVAAGSQDKSPRSVQFASVNARYVRFRMLSDSEGTPYSSMAELEVLVGPGSTAGSLDAPGGFSRADVLP